MKRNLVLVSLVASASLLVTPPQSRAQTPAQNASARTLFLEGRDLWDDGRFDDAEKKFREALTKYPKADQSDRTSYYFITTLIKLGRTAEARSQIERFNRNYPQSTWKSDVEEKRLTLNGLPLGTFTAPFRAGQVFTHINQPSFPNQFVTGSPFSVTVDMNNSGGLEQEVLRLIVERDANRGIELARERLRENPSDPAVISNLSIIAGSGTPQAMSFLLMIAGNGPSSPNTRSQALFWIGRHSDKDAFGKAVLELMKHKEAMPTVVNALGRFNPNERRNALHQIVQSPSTEKLAALESIFKNSTNASLRAQVVQSAGSIPDAAALAFVSDVARNEKVVSVRRAAIQTLAARKDTDVRTLEEILKTLPRK